MDLQIIKEYQSGISAQKIAFKYNKTIAQIFWILIKNNIPRRSLSDAHVTKQCNYNFFNKINTEEKAYFLGLLYADGSITHNSMKLTLQKRDFHILKSFKKVMNSEHNFINDRGYMRFSISNQKLYKDLLNVGCGHKKSLDLSFPNPKQVPNNLIQHFIRGFFDGDGSISFSINKKYKYIQWSFQFIGTFDMVTNIQKIFCKYISSHIENLKLSKEKRTGHGKLFYLEIGGTREFTLEKIYNYLYNDANFYLFRKYNKFLKILKIIKKSVSKKQNYKSTHPFMNKNFTMDQVKKILYDNKNNPLKYPTEILKRKDQHEVGNLYKKFNIERTFIYGNK